MNKAEFARKYIKNANTNQMLNFQIVLDIVYEYEKLTSDNRDYAKCDHKNVIAWGPDNDKCQDCGLTWPV